jgi:hypothetical protein
MFMPVILSRGQHASSLTSSLSRSAALLKRSLLLNVVAVVIGFTLLGSTAGLLAVLFTSPALASDASVQRPASVASTAALVRSSAVSKRISSWTVRPGNTLSTISSLVYRTAACWPGIYLANRKIIGGNPNVIETGQVLFIPAKCTTSLPKAASPPHSSAPPASGPITVTSYGSPEAEAEEVFGSSYSCAAFIIERESGWNVYAENPSSGAYGLPQALPGSKMASAGPDWQSDAMTQLLWMRSYVDVSYGGACGAMAFWEGHGWY